MNRRSFIKMAGLGIAALYGGNFCIGQAKNNRPNIIFLFTDDQRFDSLGCYGNKQVNTPNIDALSQGGLTFDNHYNTTAICMASRACDIDYCP